MRQPIATSESAATRFAAQRGGAMVAVFWGILTMLGLVLAMFLKSIGGSRASTANALETKLLLVAESGLSYAHVLVEQDALYAAKDTLDYQLDGATSEYASEWMPLSADADDGQQDIELRVQYLNGTTPVVFANRADPKEDYDAIRVICSARLPRLERRVAATYQKVVSEAFKGALVSDMTPQNWSTSGSKGGARGGHIAFDGRGLFYLFGDVHSNGNVNYGSVGALTDATAKTSFAAFDGSLKTKLFGTDAEVPDFTELGGSNQLFDFDRFEAAAAAGAGAVYNSLANFATAQASANSAGKPLEGIIVVKIDPAVAGGSPKLSTVPINVRGTLVFDFADGTPPGYKVFIEVPLNVNAANMTGFKPADKTTYKTGYPPVYADANKQPWKVDISASYPNFKATDDLPAMMFNNGIVDVHGAANVSGVVYGPSFIEIENKKGLAQYFNGTIIGGAGIFFQGNTKGYTAIKYDANAVDQLATMGSKASNVSRTGYSVVK